MRVITHPQPIARYIIPIIFFATLMSSCTHVMPMAVISVIKLGSFLKATMPAILLEKGVDKAIEWFSSEDPQTKKHNLSNIVPLPQYPLRGYSAEEALTVTVTGKREGRTGVTTFKIPSHYLKFERPSLDCDDCWRLTPEAQLFIAERSRIASIQLSLRDLGFDPGRVDGINGPRTQTAIKNYQETREELHDTGLLDDETINALIIEF